MFPKINSLYHTSQWIHLVSDTEFFSLLLHFLAGSSIGGLYVNDYVNGYITVIKA